MATKLRRKPFKIYIVEESAPFRTIWLCNVEATTPTFAERAGHRKMEGFMKSLQCGGYHLMAQEQADNPAANG